MTKISIRTLALAAAPFLILGCASGEQTGAGNTAGASGSRGSGGTPGAGTAGVTGSGGSPGTGGTPSGTAGSGGTVGTPDGGTAACGAPTSANPLISDFSGTTTTPVSMQANGGT